MHSTITQTFYPEVPIRVLEALQTTGVSYSTIIYPRFERIDVVKPSALDDPDNKKIQTIRKLLFS